MYKTDRMPNITPAPPTPRAHSVNLAHSSSTATEITPTTTHEQSSSTATDSINLRRESTIFRRLAARGNFSDSESDNMGETQNVNDDNIDEAIHLSGRSQLHEDFSIYFNPAISRTQK